MKIDLFQAIEKILLSPNGLSRRPIYEGYDKNVQGNTVHERGTTASAITACFRDFPELDDDHSRIGVTFGTGGNPNLAKICAKQAAIDGIVQAYLQTACVGGVALGATDCLNFGNPEKEDQMAELVEGIEGLKEVCSALAIPIVSGNVSLYNESNGNSIPPSAMVAVFSRVDDVEAVVPMAFEDSGDTIFVIGKRSGVFGGSALFDVYDKKDTRMPEIDYKTVQQMVKRIARGLKEQKISSINQIGYGGSIAAILNSAFKSNMGVVLNLSDESEVPLLFGEDMGVIISTSEPKAIKEIFGNQAQEIGVVQDTEKLRIHLGGKDLLNTNIDQLKKSWENGLRKVL